jgi:O-antigen biosynthesis protein WbqV
VVELARRFIRSQGLEPDRDVPIRFTGVRPGEKLFEELAYDSEAMQPTRHESVHVHLSRPPEEAEMVRLIDAFQSLRHSDDRVRIFNALREAVPEMQAPPPTTTPIVIGDDRVSQSA